MTMALQSRRRRAPESVLIAATRLTPKVLPALPDAVKRLMSGGRAVVIDGNTLDPTLQAFTASLRMAGITGLVTDDDVALSRRLMLGLCRGLGGERAPVDRSPNCRCRVRPGQIGAAPLPCRRGRCRRRWCTSTAAATPWVTWTAYDALCRMLCRDAGIQVFSVDYRLAPEHPAPAAVDDCLAAFRWVAGHADEFGVRPDRLAVGGDSAGGGLTAAVSQLSRDDAVVPALQLLLYPWTDIRTPTRSRTLFSSGLVLCAHDIVWCGDRYLEGRGWPPTIHGCRPGGPTTCRVCRPRWSSPPVSTRCATRATPTPPRWPPPGCRSTCARWGR